MLYVYATDPSEIRWFLLNTMRQTFIEYFKNSISLMKIIILSGRQNYL